MTPSPEAAPRLRFHVSLAPCPQAALRVLGLFAQRALLPERVLLERRPRGARLTVDVDLTRDGGEALLHRLRSIPSVRTARLHRAAA